MITQEELAKIIKLSSQNAWRVETNTTVNTICEYIAKEGLIALLASLEEELAIINKHISTLYTSVEYISNNYLEYNKPKSIGDDLNASTDGSISQPQRSEENQSKGRGRAAKAGANGRAYGSE